MTVLLVLLGFVLLLGLASMLGWTYDSRDGRDWQPRPRGGYAPRTTSTPTPPNPVSDRPDPAGTPPFSTNRRGRLAA